MSPRGDMQKPDTFLLAATFAACLILLRLFLPFVLRAQVLYSIFLSKDQLTKKKDRILIKDLISNK